MPTCRACGNKFKNLLRLDGEIYNICKRRYCIECNPFKSRKRIEKRLGDNKSPDRHCGYCNRPFVYEKKKGHSLNRCGSCRQLMRREKIKLALLKEKGGKCQKCGYDKCIDALHFHHREPSTKEFTIGSSHNRAFASLQAEADKCDLLCSNCHAETHASERRSDGSAR